MKNLFSCITAQTNPKNSRVCSSEDKSSSEGKINSVSSQNAVAAPPRIVGRNSTDSKSLQKQNSPGLTWQYLSFPNKRSLLPPEPHLSPSYEDCASQNEKPIHPILYLVGFSLSGPQSQEVPRHPLTGELQTEPNLASTAGYPGGPLPYWMENNAEDSKTWAL